MTRRLYTWIFTWLCMGNWLYRMELAVDRTIPYCILALVIAIICEILFPSQAASYVFLIDTADLAIILIFIADLSFKFRRMQSFPQFLRKYWPDIIAVFPLFLVVRVAEEYGLLLKTWRLVSEAQPLLHSGMLMGEGIYRIVSKAEELGGSRTLLLMEFFRPISKFPRLLKAHVFFERPTANHRN